MLSLPMSKAFTKEDVDHDDEEELPERLPQGQYITREGYQRLVDEVDKLWKSERPRVAAEVEAAAALGDRSENAEYIYGKKRLREIDRRLRFLAKRLDHLTVVAEVPTDRSRVFFGAWVTVEDEDGGQLTYRLVGADEIDLAKRWISPDSPVGKALLGKRVGEWVTVQRPRGEAELFIVSVSYAGS